MEIEGLPEENSSFYFVLSRDACHSSSCSKRHAFLLGDQPIIMIVWDFCVSPFFDPSSEACSEHHACSTLSCVVLVPCQVTRHLSASLTWERQVPPGAALPLPWVGLVARTAPFFLKISALTGQ